MEAEEIYTVTQNYKFFDYENQEQIVKLLAEVQQWLDQNPKINGRPDNARNLQFLRGCKYDIAKTKQKLQSYYKTKSIRKEWFDGRDPFLPEIQDLLKIGLFLPLPNKHESGRHIVIIRTAAHDPKIHSQDLVMKVNYMVLDIFLYMCPEVTTVGLMAIFDMDGVTLGHGLQMTPRQIKKSVECWSTYPSRPKMLEFVNTPTHVNIVLNTFRFFMTSKVKSRLIVRKDTSQIDEQLPKELGGKGPPYSDLAEKWKTIVEANAEFFRDDALYKSL